MSKLLSTKEVAQYLGVNEKMVYTLIAEKGLPASKVTGKWIFPQHLVDQWVEANTINLSAKSGAVPSAEGLLIIAGSNDPLLEQTIGLYNGLYPEKLAVFGNLGSLGGIRSLKQDLCHIATSHLLQENGSEYNFEVAGQLLNPMPVVVNFCRRCQGLIVAKGNPRGIRNSGDLKQPGLRVINRKLGTGTRQLFDRELEAAEIKSSQLSGYETEVQRHMDVGLAVLGGKADAGPGIQPVAEQLGLDFVPWRWERYDLLIQKERFFQQSVQFFLGLLHEDRFQRMAADYPGYDTSISGKMVFATSMAKMDGQGNPSIVGPREAL
ncbi:MAG: helix-turn-helix domain-containing protein [Desulfobacteraceae bacterium]|nr:MAG: helix-turn-helix domain-containing protein [Desulfobacteraceae bacterium]